MTFPRPSTVTGRPPTSQPRRIISLIDHQPSGYERFGKPAMDVLIAALVVLLALPVMLVIALLVVVTLGRPVLYVQKRVGLDGELFDVLKFRTMRHDRRMAARPFDGADRRVNHKDPSDPRHTAIGTFLRRFSLDELPQLINVLRGEMSIIGPRPELPSIVEEHYDAWHHRRFEVKPGLTGLWQTTARQDGVMYEHVDVDIDYVDSVGFATDLKILLATVPAVLVSQQGR